MLLPERSM
jgi:hypothetical protein